MIRRVLGTAVLGVLSALALLAGQQAQAPAGGAGSTPVAPQPKVKSQKELEAIQAMMNAVDPDSRIKAAEDLIRNFSDTEFKPFALQMATFSAQQKNDFEQMMIYGERTLEADPNSYAVMVIMAPALAQRTREFDLDKEEKLVRAEKYANTALKVLDTAAKPNPNVTDEQWAEAKNDFRSQAHEGLGLVAMTRKNYDKAIAEFKTSMEVSKASNPPTKIRLAAALNGVGKYDEAIALLDEVLADPQLHPQLKTFAQAEKVRAVKLKEAKAK